MDKRGAQGREERFGVKKDWLRDTTVLWSFAGGFGQMMFGFSRVMGRKRVLQELSGARDGLFSLLDENLMLSILDKLQDYEDRQAWCLVCKRFLAVEASSRKSVRLLRVEVVENVLRRYRYVEELDLSRCAQVDDETLESIGNLTGNNLRSLNLTHSGKFSENGLLSLVKLCPSLQLLDLSYCSQIGDLCMVAIAQLAKLETLSLFNCRNITDAGLGCIAAGCKNLRYLNLRWCLGVSDTGISLISNNCKQLETVDLSFTEVTAQGLASIAVLQNLKNLFLDSCSGVDDAGLACLQKLQKSLLVLDVARCQDVTDKGLMTLASDRAPLQKLCLSYCLPITDGLLARLEKLKSLQVIRLDGCVIAGVGLASIGKGWKALREFSVSKVRGVTDGQIRSVVERCRNLQDLDFTCCRELTDLAITSVAACCKNLRSLKMESCSLVTDKGLALLGSNCTALEVVDFTDCNITDEGLKHLAACTGLRTLKLGYCLNITDKGIKYIASRCNNLREIDLYRSVEVGDSAVSSLAYGCPRLRSINLSYCTKITDASLHSISKLRDLTQLEVRACSLLTSAGFVSIAGGCRKLLELDIKRCTSVDDNALLAIAYGCPNLREVNLSYCRITDIGLMAIARLSFIQNLKLLHLKGVSLDGLVEALFSSGALRKVKLLSSLRMVLSGLTTQAVESRGCRLRWMDKPES
ncbi:hypothetical protein R1flu_014369 [Riccia fluitans]|uniref:F-box/LRR-repeat protein 15-like leucin rich repeat domain-containing protein n=1 Tax=Riccia fluitans TaxID=41844 RepID=A0ABD1YG56_9MARC